MIPRQLLEILVHTPEMSDLHCPCLMVSRRFDVADDEIESEARSPEPELRSIGWADKLSCLVVGAEVLRELNPAAVEESEEPSPAHCRFPAFIQAARTFSILPGSPTSSAATMSK